jgi:hypothetical protein
LNGALEVLPATQSAALEAEPPAFTMPAVHPQMLTWMQMAFDSWNWMETAQAWLE